LGEPLEEWEWALVQREKAEKEAVAELDAKIGDGDGGSAVGSASALLSWQSFLFSFVVLLR
jgi:hypothetical protein